ncbi:DUF397 domain-containing protein [Dactylosporangium sp. NPDC000521]|uniref:DUF397 domain-containing protein n=1 Tax=Dactylosporangium sp. NPDC000521 TaxID=3363975 RepID=UPI00367EAFD3
MADGANGLTWRKSRSCASAACVEVARAEDRFLVRDSKNPEGPRLGFGAEDWASFIGAVREGRIE